MEFIRDFFQLFWYDDHHSDAVEVAKVDSFIIIKQIDNQYPVEDPDPDDDHEDPQRVPFLTLFSIDRQQSFSASRHRNYGTMYQRIILLND
jgi:hypothetical protein